MKIDVTETRVELSQGGSGYAVEWYDLQNHSLAQTVMTNLSTSGWRLQCSQYVFRDERHYLLCVWEYHGPKGGLHYREPIPMYRW